MKVSRVSRATRAQFARQAAQIRADHQRLGAPVPAIYDQITRDLPITPLEAWRFAYGWSRRHVVEAVVQVYRSDGLAEPGLSTAMLCRWEHGQTRPGLDYLHALARVYGTDPTRLGVPLPRTGPGWYGQRIPQPRQEPPMRPEYPELTAVADSISLHGTDAGADLAEQALGFYETRYSDFPPRVMAAEVARCRSLLMSQPGTDHRRVLGWFSALLGNLAHHTGDGASALIHLGTAARLADQTGDTRLSGWALGAQSMVTLAQGRPAEALELADHAAQYATTPLRRAQITAWCRLRPLAVLADTRALTESVLRARRDMDACDDEPGRFGFDRAEFELHVAEALLEHDPGAAMGHAHASAGHKRVGSPGWAAAMAVHARAEAAQHRAQDAVGRAERLLEAVPVEALRANTVVRLRSLVEDLSEQSVARSLRERVHALG
ncbi:XRE family transcriptional regulator (plasmid) [Nocardiopsis exhalans]|uniref:XRE family transcriptional regulator n=1 Tax=Nocardiopsis exhalans TaxID=163604 RepID=A0ABY5DJP5_9ACTN|nr:XRE family transcriptional regulator [Nocardiopsis exhalans]USY23573.1 XRE family transcriptional regulator [Nocardiopsis exhalans]